MGRGVCSGEKENKGKETKRNESEEDLWETQEKLEWDDAGGSR